MQSIQISMMSHAVYVNNEPCSLCQWWAMQSMSIMSHAVYSNFNDEPCSLCEWWAMQSMWMMSDAVYVNNEPCSLFKFQWWAMQSMSMMSHAVYVNDEPCSLCQWWAMQSMSMMSHEKTWNLVVPVCQSSVIHNVDVMTSSHRQHLLFWRLQTKQNTHNRHSRQFVFWLQVKLSKACGRGVVMKKNSLQKKKRDNDWLVDWDIFIASCLWLMALITITVKKELFKCYCIPDTTDLSMSSIWSKVSYNDSKKTNKQTKIYNVTLEQGTNLKL